MKHLREDWGVSATIASLVIVGAFIIIWKVIDKADPDIVIALAGGWVSAIVSAILVIKSAKKKE